MTSTTVDTIKANNERLKRYQALETHAARLIGGWLPGVARWEIKKQLGYHLWEDLKHSQLLRTRLWELRINTPDRDLDPALAEAIERLAVAQHDYEAIAGIYRALKTELLAAYRRYAANTYQVYDHPSVIALNAIIPGLAAQVEWANRVVRELADTGDKRRNVQRWLTYAGDVVAAIGGVDGDQPRAGFPVPPPGYATLLPCSEARRDERFTIQVTGAPIPDEADNMGWLLWQFSNYTQEMQAAETLATVMWEAKGMAWEFYFDIPRHCWAEVRHVGLAETPLAKLAHTFTDFPCRAGS